MLRVRNINVNSILKLCTVMPNKTKIKIAGFFETLKMLFHALAFDPKMLVSLTEECFLSDPILTTIKVFLIFFWNSVLFPAGSQLTV